MQKATGASVPMSTLAAAMRSVLTNVRLSLPLDEEEVAAARALVRGLEEALRASSDLPLVMLPSDALARIFEQLPLEVIMACLFAAKRFAPAIEHCLELRVTEAR